MLNIRPRRRISRLIATFAAAMIVSGCATEIDVFSGQPVEVAALRDKLVLGRSTERDVVAALGAPFGRGRAMMPFHDRPRDKLSYYYERGDLQDDRRTFLWVFLRDGVYDGHIWFSSLPNP